MAISENLYLQLGRLLEVMPDLTNASPSLETHRWLGQAYALVQSTGDVIDAVSFKTMTGRLNSAARPSAAQEIYAIIFRALAVAELSAPGSMQGSFLPVGNSFDVFAVISKLFKTAQKDVLIIDPYMDATALTDFTVAVPEGINVRLLTDKNDYKPSSLLPAAQRWIDQYSSARPLSLRLAPTKALHDRAIFIDGTTAYTLTQSLNGFAKRSPAEIIRADAIAPMKIAAYENIWSVAEIIH